MKYIFLFSFLSLIFVSEAFAGPKILDGDSLRFGKGDEIRLIGIDAPEYKQECYDKESKIYDCGEKAKKALIEIIGGKKVVCKKIKKDIYKRYLSECYVGEVSINQEMLKQGWAVAYRTKEAKYLDAQNYAKSNSLGLWQGKFMKPELHRALNRK